MLYRRGSDNERASRLDYFDHVGALLLRERWLRCRDWWGSRGAVLVYRHGRCSVVLESLRRHELVDALADGT
jgi:hypothetical protein